MAPTSGVSASGNTTSVQVAVRIRPPPSDTSNIPTRFQRTAVHSVSNTTISVDNAPSGPAAANTASPPAAAAASSAGKKSVFTFDQVLPPDTTQYELFTTTAAPLVSRFIEGFNCTILAYGQTSSGKTHSMTGVDLDADPNDITNGMGIIPRAVSTIFERANTLKRERGQGWQYSIKASFIELYNEDLIDLLSVEDSSGSKRDVQIREDKDGHIIWGGLREIPVRSAADVMSILIRGTSLRRTNETDMNAQSSRSHAIFSLTMTQKKYVGGGNPSLSSSRLSGRNSPMPGAPTASRISRPGSMIATSASRVSSPTFGRAPTPSFASAMARGSTSSLRPASALAIRSGSPDGDEDKGEWVTVTSKFHFVDLAGSERLKRTAAVGERIKEGISINGGLLALGNVISALGDPSRARTLGHGNTPIHVPYRDSKLTRLLQDSLGGNAHTLMIACVSPAEWNVTETVNTLKYANRARNIRNRAEIREKEEGWDDIEWLQKMVDKLRKELKALKEGGPSASTTSISTVAEDERPATPASLGVDPATSNPRASMMIAPDRAGGKVLKQYTDLQESYRTLRNDYMERNEELSRLRQELEEKSSPAHDGLKYQDIVAPVIEEYEKTIESMEAELKLSRTALEHTNEMFEEQENELASVKERNANADSYIEALRARVAKLAEREASTETYVRDLEAKLKTYSDQSSSADSSVAELRKEIAHYKETEGSSATYISNLEQRLMRADADIVSLRAQVEKLERELEARDASFRSLQARMDAFIQEREDAESWREDLLAREARVRELEAQMEEWEKIRKETSAERSRLNSLVSNVSAARHTLSSELPHEAINGTDAPASLALAEPSTSSTSTIVPHEPTHVAELTALQKVHSDTLTELESVTNKYQDALRELSSLTAQLAECRPQSSDTASDVGSDAGSYSPRPQVPRTPPSARRGTLSRREYSETPTTPPVTSPSSFNSRRHIFRHANSIDGLHTRSQSQSASQELYSPSFFPRGSWAGNGDSLLSPGSVPSRLSVKASSESIRSAISMEKEIMRLQEVLKEREAEISMLEKSLAASAPQLFPAAPELPKSSSLLAEVQEETDASSMDTEPLSSVLSPTTMNQVNALKTSLLIDTQAREAEQKEAESISRLDELMRSMAQKESQHVAAVDGLNDELNSLRKQRDELLTLSNSQAENLSTQALEMSSEIDGLRKQLATIESHHTDLASELEQLRSREAELLAAKETVAAEHAKAVESIREEHAAELRRHEEERVAMVERHDRELTALRSALEEQDATHANALQQSVVTHDTKLAQVLEKHTDEKAQIELEFQSRLQAAIAEHTSTLDRVKTEHQTTLTAATAEHEAAIARHAATANDAVFRLREDHSAELKRSEMAREATLTDSQSRQAELLQGIEEAHQATLARKEAELSADLEKEKAEHVRLLTVQEESHSTRIASLQSEFAEKETKLTKTFEEAKGAHAAALSSREASYAADVETMRNDYSEALKVLETAQDQEIATLKDALARSQQEHAASSSSHRDELEAAVVAATAAHETEMQARVAEHAETIAKLKAEHQASVSELQASLIAVQEAHHEKLADLRREHEEGMVQERKVQSASLADLDRMHSEERESLRSAHNLLAAEVEAMKAAAAKAEEDARQARAEVAQVLTDKDSALASLQQESSSTEVVYKDTIQQLRDELERVRSEQSTLVHEASKRESLVSELEHHRSLLGDTQQDLQKTKDEMDTLREEKNRQDQLVRELQAQIAIPPPNVVNHRLGGLPPLKPPPLTPPPSIPPPPVPTSVPAVPALSTEASNPSIPRSESDHTVTESDTSGPSTPTTSIVGSPSGGDMKLQNQVEDQAKQIDEQEAMIKTLTKQLTHCEGDLQAHMDLVATLETSLNDSERNLRKARAQSNELAKERNSLNTQIETLRGQLQQAQQEIATVRRSVVEEKQNFETKLDEERRAKERTRAQLDTRMEELQKRKSKFVCL